MIFNKGDVVYLKKYELYGYKYDDDDGSMVLQRLDVHPPNPEHCWNGDETQGLFFKFSIDLEFVENGVVLFNMYDEGMR